MTARAGLLIGLAFLVAVMWGLSLASKRLERVAQGVMPLEARSFEGVTAALVGTGGTHENHLRLGPSVAVGSGRTVVLIDAGRGLAQALRAAEIPVAQPRTVLLTSLLPENTLGLDDWLLTAALDASFDGEGPLRVLGPPGTRALVEALRAAHAAGLRAQLDALGREGAPEVEARDVSTSRDVATSPFDAEVGPLRIRAAGLAGGPLPALVWRLEGDDGSVVVAGAGWDPEAVVTAASGATLLVHAALSGEALDRAVAADLEGADALAAEGRLHLRLEDAGALATRAGVRALALVRLRPPPLFAFQYERLVSASFRGLVLIAEDGDLVPLSQGRVTR